MNTNFIFLNLDYRPKIHLGMGPGLQLLKSVANQVRLALEAT